MPGSNPTQTCLLLEDTAEDESGDDTDDQPLPVVDDPDLDVFEVHVLFLSA